ncbi:MAG: WYL domain-containing protein [Lachnospiraceae bacterium]|nr:WYL domain-containing protein [Lachnospiraceae bacterium]
MVEELKNDKIQRVLQIYAKLSDGYIVNKAEEALIYGVNERSIQRDIDDIRCFLDADFERTGIINTVVYDRMGKGYRLETLYTMRLTNSEILALCKILLDSRAFTKDEMVGMLDKLITCCVPKSNQKLVQDLIRNEEFHYVEPRHKSEFINRLWDIGLAIRNTQYIEIKYQGVQGSTVKTRKLKPVAIMFSEYYFYMAAFIEDKNVRENFRILEDAFPTIYRVDRIQGLVVLDEHFKIPYKDKFEEGEFRKRIQFMYGGKLRKVTFLYSGYSVEAVLDRLPTAKILSEEDGVYTITAEVFGDGIDMWLRSQGDNIEII